MNSPVIGKDMAVLRAQVALVSLKVLTVAGFVVTSWSFFVDHPFKYVHLCVLLLVAGAIPYQEKLPNFAAYALFFAWYLIGITELLSYGTNGAQIEAYVVATFFLGALIGARCAIIGVAICLLSTLIVAAFLHNGWLALSGDGSSLPLNWSGWVYPLLSIPLFAGSISGATAYLTNRLSTSLSHSNALVERLEQEVAEKESAMQHSQEVDQMYRLLADNVKDVVFTLDLEFNTTYVSPSVYAQRGFTVDEVMEMTFEENVTRESIPVVMQALSDEMALEGTADSDRSRSIEYEIYCKGGKTINVESVISFLRDGEGNPVSILGIQRDITDRIQSEAERATIQQKMQDMQKLESLGLLAGGIAHDFNNLLLGIMGNTDLAMMKMNPADPAGPYLKDVLSSSQQAADLCKQLLAYSGKGKFVVQPVSLGDLVQEMANLLEVSLGKNTVVRYEFGEDLPSVEGDVTQLRQVVMNLILNASDAMGEDSGVITISVSRQRCDREYLGELLQKNDLEPGQYVILEISDTGCGMDEATKAQIFDPFYSTKEQGHGLGMAAVLGIVHGHQGAVKVYSEVGKGTSIKLLFPASDKEAVSTHRAQKEVASQTAEGTILVVDDEPLVRNFTKAALEYAGYVVLTAEHGKDALRVYESHADVISLVLLDMTMPIMGGEETFLELQKRDDRLPIILSSGFNEQDATARFIGKGNAGFIQKPYLTKDLLQQVEETLAHRPQATSSTS